MKRETILTIAAVALAVLGLFIGFLGLFSGQTIILPPIVTGIGFLVIAWVFFAFRSKAGD